MKILVVMPFDHCYPLLKECDTSRPEYAVIVNGVMKREGEQITIEILCDLGQAEKLLDFARQVYPAAAASIEESIRLRRQL